MPNNRHANWIIAAVVVVILACGIALGLSRRKPATTPTTISPDAAPIEATSSPAASTPPAGGRKTTDSAYTKAVATYPYRIQFAQCRGIVNTIGNGTLALKAGDKFMLDNRDATQHIIAFAGQSYAIGGGNFAIASVGKKGTYNVTCDKGGAATLKVE